MHELGVPGHDYLSSSSLADSRIGMPLGANKGPYRARQTAQGGIGGDEDAALRGDRHAPP